MKKVKVVFIVFSSALFLMLGGCKNPFSSQSESSDNVAVTSVAAPTVSSISPSSGTIAGGTSVTITGTGFSSGAAVSIGGSSATSVLVNSSTQLTCTTPAHALGSVSVSVTNPDSQSASLSGGYTYVNPAPTLSSLSVATGTTLGGTSVTITGTGFLSGATVTFGGASATSVNVVSATSITCVSPTGSAGAVNVVVTNTDNQSATLVGGYTYTPSLNAGLKAGLVSFWTLNGGVTDSTSTGNNGAWSGTAAYSTGLLDQAASFTGSSYVNCGDSPSSLPTASSDRSISAWVNPSSHTGLITIAGWGVDSGRQLSEVVVTGSNLIQFHGNGADYNSAGTISNSAWSYVVVTLASNVLYFYINGTLDVSRTLSEALITSGSNCKIGRQPNFNGQYFKGYIDEVGIWNRALSASEISTLYNGGVGLTY